MSGADDATSRPPHRHRPPPEVIREFNDRGLQWLFEDPEKTVQAAMVRLRERNRLLPGDPVVVVSDIDAGEERVTTIQVRKFR